MRDNFDQVEYHKNFIFFQISKDLFYFPMGISCYRSILRYQFITLYDDHSSSDKTFLLFWN